MNSEQTQDISEQQPRNTAPDNRAAPDDRASSGAGTSQPATVIVRGETVQPANGQTKNGSSKDKEGGSRKKLSEAKVKMQSRLPVLDDDSDVGVQKEQTVVRDGKADLAFTGTLVASAAPDSAPSGRWDEYRIYETSSGKHVFSKIARNVVAEEHDTNQAEIFDPEPSSVPTQLARKAHDLTHSRPMTWTDAAVDFFGYDPLAKALYRKLGNQFEERVS